MKPSQVIFKLGSRHIAKNRPCPVRALKRAQFGKKSEAWESQEQLKMTFNEVEVEAKKAQESDSKTEVTSHKRKARGHRKPLPEHLAREVVRIELPAEELKTEDPSDWPLHRALREACGCKDLQRRC
jgi:hypothetical protein